MEDALSTHGESDAWKPRSRHRNGAADLAIAFALACPDCRVSGVDFVSEVLARGHEKVARAGLSDRIELVFGWELAYAYLYSLINAFLDQEALAKLMRSVGLGRIEIVRLSEGIAYIHAGIKARD